MDIKIKIDSIELRSLNKCNGNCKSFEVVQWLDDTHCSAIGFFNFDDSDDIPDFVSVGYRPWVDLSERERQILDKIIFMFYNSINPLLHIDD